MSSESLSLDVPTQAPRRRGVVTAGWLLVAAFLAFPPVVALSAVGPMTAGLNAAAAARGIEYINGSLPLEVYLEVATRNQGAAHYIQTVLSVAVWVLFAVAIWRATLLKTPLTWAGIGARVAASTAPLAWIAMLAFDVLLLVQRGDGLSGSYYALWLGGEAVLSAAAAASVLFTVVQLGEFVPRVLRWVLIVLATGVAVGSLALMAFGGLPPIAGPVLACALGVGLLVRARRVRVNAP